MPFRNEKWFKKLVEDQERMAKLVDPFRDSILKQQHLFDSINQTTLAPYKDIFESLDYKKSICDIGTFDDLYSIKNEILSGFGGIDAITNELELLRTSTHFDSTIQAHEQIYRTQDHFASVLDAVRLPSERIESALATVEDKTLQKRSGKVESLGG